MKETTYFAVMGNSDTTEGRGSLFTIACFSSETQAFAFCKQYGDRWEVFGSPLDPATYVKAKTVRIYDTLEEACEGLGIETENTKAQKAAALAKLTAKERKLLGL